MNIQIFGTKNAMTPPDDCMFKNDRCFLSAHRTVKRTKPKSASIFKTG